MMKGASGPERRHLVLEPDALVGGGGNLEGGIWSCYTGVD